ncbi:MAG: hypothetical protein J5640_06850 [Bacteroidales bacterium]|nr:hypothetical protein [Bacteroidales bacterium]
MDAVQYGIKNIGPLILMIVLYILTVWIPYINIGTTIGLYKATIKIGRGEVINPLDIFQKENRNNLGDFFILMGLMSMGISVAAVFMLIPAIVMCFAWMFAIFFFIDKGLSPTKCLKISYKATDGEKWNIFLVYLVLGVCISILSAIFGLIPKVGWIFVLALFICYMAVTVAVEGVMYAHFQKKADEMFAEGQIGCGCKAPEAPAAPAEPEPAPEAPAAE